MDSYKRLRKIQKDIVEHLEYKNDYFFNYINCEEVIEYSNKLAKKYFTNTVNKSLEIANWVIDLYRIYLVLAPVLQRKTHNFKIDWTRGHFLSWIRANANKRVNRHYCKVYEYERERNIEKLQARMRNNFNIKDTKFIEFVSKYLEKAYNRQGVVGNLANLIFDPILVNEGFGFGLRYQNKFIRLEKSKFEDCIDLDKNSVDILDYKVRRIINKNNAKTTLLITLNEKTINSVKAQIKAIVNSEHTTRRKILLLNNFVNSFVEKHKYAKDIYNDILEIERYFKSKIKSIAAQDKSVKLISFVKKYKDKKISKMLFKKPNFFWDANSVDEDKYLYYFSPYRED